MKTRRRSFLIAILAAALAAHGWGQERPAGPAAKASRAPATRLENPITEAYLKEHLAKQTPRLILTPQIATSLRQKIVTDPLVRTFYQHLQREAAAILGRPLSQHTLEGFRMPGGRELAESLGILAIIHRLDRRPAVLARIDAQLRAVCQFPDWNPQHFLDVSQTAVGVALALDWAGDALPAETVKLAQTALIEKALLPSYNTAGERMGWITGNNNWNSVCHGGMVTAALAIAEVNPALAAKTIARALEHLPNSLKEYAPDGAHPEGPSYWRFGTSYSVLAANVLTTALGRDFGIAQSPGFMASAIFRLQMNAPSGEAFDFADSDSKMDGETSVLLAWFAAQTGDALYLHEPFFSQPAGAGRFAGLGLVWLAQFSPQRKSELAREWLGRGPNPTAVFRTGKKSADQLYLAIKGGAAQISHGNMDAGTFILELNGVRWVVDPGNQEYYPLNKIGFPLSDYSQNSERWALLTKSNLTHSTITVNDARFKVTASAPIRDFQRGEKPGATIDLTEALNGQIKSLQRRFVAEGENSILIEDRFETNELTQVITWRLMTLADVTPTKSGAILRQAGKELALSILSPDDLHVTVASLDPPPLKIDKVISGLKRVEIRFPASRATDGHGVLRVRLSAPYVER